MAQSHFNIECTETNIIGFLCLSCRKTTFKYIIFIMRQRWDQVMGASQIFFENIFYDFFCLCVCHQITAIWDFKKTKSCLHGNYTVNKNDLS